MRLDRANRSFLAFMGIALLLGALVFCGALGGVLMPLILARASRGESLGLPGAWLLPVFPFVGLIAVGIGLGSRSLVRQMTASRRLARRVDALVATAPVELAGAAVQTGLDGRLLFMDSSDSFSFVYGILTPRVAVSRGLLEGVSRLELRAVLEHERYHVCNLDPLKVVLVRALSATLFFLPALDSLRARYVAGRELAADRRAVAICGRRPLAKALLKVARSPDWSELGVAAAIGGSELLAVRVNQLEIGAEPKPEALGVTRVAFSLMGVTLLTLAFLASVSSFGGPTAVYHATGTGLTTATLLGGLYCTAPFAGAGLLAYTLIAIRASRPL
ncbi:MAG TPA: M56 family metallopeptidase [Solirubrobacteraceae bacterium]|nr:M56 family metallopeptidase [Solirubrobacteraceae bacterium]